MKALLATVAISLLCAPPILAQAEDTGKRLAAMEQTLFGKVFCRDTPIRRLERLEQNFSEPSRQKSKPLQERIDDMLAKVNPSPESLQQPDPCASSAQSKKGPRSVFAAGLLGAPPQGAWTERTYPFTNWESRPIETITGGVAQLKTDYANAKAGRMKFILLIKLPENTAPRYYMITFLDEHGFKLSKFVVDGRLFDATEGADGSRLWQAKDQAFVPEKEYRQARDYTVTPVF